MNLIEEPNIIFNISKSITRDEVINIIANLAFKNKIVTSAQEVFSAFLKRENLGTTGFEDGFAIPHARSKSVLKPQIFIFRNDAGIKDWETIDKKAVKVAIFLLIPDQATSLHIDILSTIATNLLEENFRNILKNNSKKVILARFLAIIALIKNPLPAKIIKNNSPKKFIAAITACPAGIAKTFMAKKKLEIAAKEKGFNIHVETQGGGNQKNALNSTQIAKAECIIVASDINIKLERFVNKKILITNTKEAICEPLKLLERGLVANLLTSEKLQNNSNGKKKISNWLKDTKSSVLQMFNKPWVYLSIMACLYSIIGLIGFAIYHQSWITNGYAQNETLFAVQMISFRGFELCMALFAAYFAKKFYNSNKVFILTFLFTFILNTPLIGSVSILGVHGQDNQTIKLWFSYGSTFNPLKLMGTSLFGGIIFGPLIAYFCKWIDLFISQKITNKWAKLFFNSWINYLFIAAILTSSIFIAAPLAWVFQWVIKGLVIYPNSYWWLRFIIGGVVGILITHDYGGTINKFTILFLVGMTQYDWRMRSLFAIAIPIASLSTGLFFKVFRKKIISADLGFAQEAERLGRAGLSEGPLGLVNKYKWKAHIPSLFCAFIATGLIFVLNIQIFKTGGVGIMVFGAQAYPGYDLINHLVISNDISWLNSLIVLNNGVAATIFSSLAYGIIGYWLTFAVGIIVYFATAGITFNLGKKRPFKAKSSH